MRVNWLNKFNKTIRRITRRISIISECSGTSMVEVLVALAIAGGALIMLLSSLATGSKALGIMDELTKAGNLAQSQMEYSKSLPFIKITTPGSTIDYATVPSIPSNFSVTATASEIAGKSTDIQKITVTVFWQGETIFTEEGYKVNR